MIALSADVGGTFTDVVLVDSSTSVLHADKVLTTPGSTDAIVEGVQRLCERAGIAPSAIDVVIHGFTIATNAWLTRSGARIALAVTDGFRDVLEIATQRRPDPYALQLRLPAPLVGRANVVEVPERIDASGRVVEPLDEAAAAAVADRIATLRPEAVAISLLFSYLDDAHEQRLARAVRAALPGVPVYTSAAINPQIEEYPRTNTTATAAYVGPAVDRYVGRLERALPEAGVRAPILLMRSDGGVATIAATRENPATMLMSGPAGGVIAAEQISRTLAAPDIITFDMGGTSADFSLIAGGRARTINEREIRGERLRMPSLDIHTLSAGGGSIGSVDIGGALRVGPQSAGSVPGPACYGRGGTLPTLTDAALLVGLLSADAYLGGEMTLDVGAAERAVAEHLARPLSLSVADAAHAMLAVANAQMGQAIRGLAVERGHDLRQFALLSYGGAGSIFAPFLARDLQMREVLVPLRPGVFSATGLLLTDMRHTLQLPLRQATRAADAAQLRERYGQLVETARAMLARDGVAEGDQHFECLADMRYIGQAHDLTVPLPVEVLHGGWDGAQAHRLFLQQHEQAYGFADAGMDSEIVQLRLLAVGRMPKAEVAAAPPPAGAERAVGERRVYLGPSQGEVQAQVLRRADLRPGECLHGPLVINQPDTTIFVLPGQRMTVCGRTGILRLRAVSGGEAP